MTVLKHGSRIYVTDEILGYAPDDWRYLGAGNEWYNPASQSMIADEDMPDELKPEERGSIDALWEASREMWAALLGRGGQA